ncbi:MAG: hypothetical protein QOG77_1885, partial [Solirubrobacteraceae bacterium]|nr:hypothetical protein [Solirubrobacteraceae bacterium]
MNGAPAISRSGCQRSALVKRELGGQQYDDIARTFETSPATAKQTVYEARMYLQQLAGGRAIDCDEIRRTLSDGDGRSRRARRLRAYLRACADCRVFGELIVGRRVDLAAFAPPLTATSSAAILHGLLADGASAATGSGAAAAPGRHRGRGGGCGRDGGRGSRLGSRRDRPGGGRQGRRRRP